ncbi:MAG: sigma-70 family RNA polymerase sigma factor [Planctomycetes bacterium]|nr:sigma-70 family RNA polymerase sigma factor [Planctomycetota bacterium]
MTLTPDRDDFLQLLEPLQARLFTYIYSLLHDMNDTQDVLQQTVLKMWEEFENYDPQHSFAAWAHTLARFQALGFIRDRQRGRVVFSDALTAKLAERPAIPSANDDSDVYREALDHCQQKLRESDQDLLRQFYVEDCSVARISQQTGRSAQSVCNSLRRIRGALFNCIRGWLASRGQA